jgi:hypothetical protein
LRRTPAKARDGGTMNTLFVNTVKR